MHHNERLVVFPITLEPIPDLVNNHEVETIPLYGFIRDAADRDSARMLPRQYLQRVIFRYVGFDQNIHLAAPSANEFSGFIDERLAGIQVAVQSVRQQSDFLPGSSESCCDNDLRVNHIPVVRGIGSLPLQSRIEGTGVIVQTIHNVTLIKKIPGEHAIVLQIRPRHCEQVGIGTIAHDAIVGRFEVIFDDRNWRKRPKMNTMSVSNSMDTGLTSTE